MWTAPINYYEGEDETAIKAEFVRMSARYPDRPALEVAQYVFNKLRDSNRALIAAPQWSRDLEVLEQIRLKRLELAADTSGTAEKRIGELHTIATNERIEPRDRIAAYKLIAEMRGELDTKPDKGKRSLPRIIEYVLQSE